MLSALVMLLGFGTQPYATGIGDVVLAAVLPEH